MRLLRLLLGVLGVLVALLGALWLAQGTGLVRLDPVACVGECRPVEAPSLTWSVVGAFTLGLGAAAATWALRRRRRPSERA